MKKKTKRFLVWAGAGLIVLAAVGAWGPWPGVFFVGVLVFVAGLE